VRRILRAVVQQDADDKMGGPCSTNGEERNAYRLLMGKPDGKRPLAKDQDVGGWIIL
jgi:hypothetical protein